MFVAVRAASFLPGRPFFAFFLLLTLSHSTVQKNFSQKQTHKTRTKFVNFTIQIATSVKEKSDTTFTQTTLWG
jgi:hypothetical protein